MNVNVFTRFYIDQSPERQRELERCFYKNSINKEINFFPIKTDYRMKYNDFFELINKSTSNSDINIISNSDIYFDTETVRYFNRLKENQCFALSRWDEQKDGSLIHFCRPDTQDVWAFRGHIKNVDGDFFLGYRGCDNRIAYELKKSGLEISNPSKTIKTIHVHNSGIRYYTLNDSLVPGPYLTLEPISL